MHWPPDSRGEPNTTTLFGADQDAVTLVAGEDAPDGPTEMPEKIGRYVVLAPLGEGGMGVVYSALDQKLGRKVALKLLRTSGRRRGLNAEPRLLREAQALARLSHPNVVGLFDVGTMDGRVVLAMEHVDGTTLGQWQRQPERAWPEVVAAYVQAGRGLAAAHRKQLVHRDFKPDNAVIDARGRVRVLDFGLAIQESDEELEVPDEAITVSSRLTMSGLVMGTPVYMSPQQLAGEPADALTDQYSFCVALFEALYGHRPFAGGTFQELARQTSLGRIREPSDRRGVPNWVHNAIRRGLAPAPEDRWPSMDALLARLDVHRRRRRRQSAALALTGLSCAAAVTLGMHADAASERRPCRAVSEKIDAAWNADVRRAMGERAALSELSYASQTWTRVEAGLESYANAWVGERREACEAQDQAPEALDLRMQCLDDRLATFVALVDVLQDPDAAVVRQASRAVAGLPALERCQDVGALRSDQAEAPAADVADEVAAIRNGLASVKALELAGLYQPGLDAANALVERARAAEYAPVTAWALLRAGNLHGHLGQYAQAEALQSEAAMLAVEVGDGVLAARAMSQLTGVVGYSMARPEEGLRWGRHAQSMIERARLGRRAQAQLTNNIGASHFRAGDYESALARYEEAAATLEAPSNDIERQELASAHNNRGNTLALLGRLEEAVVHLELAYDLIVELRGEDHPDLAVITGNLANVYLHTGRFDQSVAYQTRSLEIRLATLPLLHPHVAATYGNLALAHSGRGEHEIALRYLQRAVELKEAAVGSDHPDLALSLNNLGEAQRASGHFDDAIESHTRAKQIWVDAQGEDHPYRGYPAANLGLDHLEAGRLDTAKRYLERALVLCEPAKRDPTLLGLVRLGLARIAIAEGGQEVKARELTELAGEVLDGTRYRDEAQRARILLATLPG
ncbi:MAG: serine/threonine-protein kinase [Myxococcota bacterium]